MVVTWRTSSNIASRSGGGIEVALIWDRDGESLVVFAYDVLTGEEVAIPVSSEGGERGVPPSLCVRASFKRNNAFPQKRSQRSLSASSGILA